jgi:hypothetical protein
MKIGTRAQKRLLPAMAISKMTAATFSEDQRSAIKRPAIT